MEAGGGEAVTKPTGFWAARDKMIPSWSRYWGNYRVAKKKEDIGRLIMTVVKYPNPDFTQTVWMWEGGLQMSAAVFNEINPRSARLKPGEGPVFIETRRGKP